MDIDPRELNGLEQKVYAAAFGAAFALLPNGNAASGVAERAVEALRAELAAEDRRRLRAAGVMVDG